MNMNQCWSYSLKLIKEKSFQSVLPGVLHYNTGAKTQHKEYKEKNIFLLTNPRINNDHLVFVEIKFELYFRYK